MIKANTEAVHTSILEAKDTIKNKLENMVARFAMNVAKSASEKTRIGDPGSIGTNAKYTYLYQKREEVHGIPMEVGFHKGAWEYSEGGDISLTPVISSVPEMLTEVTLDAKAQYKLGDTFEITAKGPAYGMLQAEDKIGTNAVQFLEGIYRTDLQQYYKE